MHKCTRACVYKLSPEVCGDQESRHSFLSSTGCGVTFQIWRKIISKQSWWEGARFWMLIHLLPFSCHFALSSCKLGESSWWGWEELEGSLQNPSVHFTPVGIETWVVKSTFLSPGRVRWSLVFWLKFLCLFLLKVHHRDLLLCKAAGMGFAKSEVLCVFSARITEAATWGCLACWGVQWLSSVVSFWITWGQTSVLIWRPATEILVKFL